MSSEEKLMGELHVFDPLAFQATTVDRYNFVKAVPEDKNHPVGKSVIVFSIITIPLGYSQ